ncbi:hypothetical protein SAMN05445504_9465 [Burkholderia sp. CF099]|nr:hypothetical protein SAMN05445504_9465 [Burkholderia sp. CF099]
MSLGYFFDQLLAGGVSFRMVIHSWFLVLPPGMMLPPGNCHCALFCDEASVTSDL